MRYLESSIHRVVRVWGKRGNEEFVFNGNGFSLEDEKVLEVDGGDGWETVNAPNTTDLYTKRWLRQ